MNQRYLLTLLISASFLGGCAQFERLILRDDYARAVALFDQGQYGDAIASIESLLDRYPVDSPERGELMYLKGEAQFQLKDYQSAQTAIQSYVEEFPNGSRQSEAAKSLVKIAEAKSSQTPINEDRLRQALNDIETLYKLEMEHPSDPRIKYYLGNAYYGVGNYKKAGRYYFEAQAIEAAYKQKDLIQQRLFINAKGEPEALTPETIKKIEKDNDPVVVFDILSYYQRNENDLFNSLSRPTAYNITGKVRNQGSEPLRNVSIEVRFVNAVNKVVDIENVKIGELDPGEVRPFLAQAERYDTILNIARVETFPRFRQE